MLVPIIFIVAFLIALTGTLLETSFLAAKIAQHDAVAQYSDVAIAYGVADFTHGLATFVELHGPGGPWPHQKILSLPKSACDPAASASQCPFRYIISAAITDASGAGEALAGDAAVNLQATVINEQRVSVIVSATVLSPTGAGIGTRTRFLTYRVFDTAPYAIISGSRDITTVNGARSAAQGDSGGASALPVDSSGPSAEPGPDARTPSAQSDDTRIHVRLTCKTIIKDIKPFSNDQQVAGNGGLPWGNAAQAAHETACTSPDAPADVFRNEHWTNGDANASAWTQ